MSSFKILIVPDVQLCIGGYRSEYVIVVKKILSECKINKYVHWDLCSCLILLDFVLGKNNPTPQEQGGGFESQNTCGYTTESSQQNKLIGLWGFGGK